MAGKEKQRISSAEIASFCNQIGLILEAGLPLYDGLESMCISVKGTKEEALYKAVFDGFNETGSLHSALKKEGSWPDYMTELIGIGEQTGQLEYVVKGLAVYYERESRLRSAITSAVTYPLVLGVLLVIIADIADAELIVDGDGVIVTKRIVDTTRSTLVGCRHVDTFGHLFQLPTIGQGELHISIIRVTTGKFHRQ